MKYRIVKSDLFINNKLYPEGKEVELTKEQTKGIEDFLVPITQSRHSEQREESQQQVSKKKLKTKGNKK